MASFFPGFRENPRRLRITSLVAKVKPNFYFPIDRFQKVQHYRNNFLITKYSQGSIDGEGVMVRDFLMRRGGFLVLAASMLVLLLATAGWADKTLPPEKLPDGSTRVTTTDDAGKMIKTVDTSKTSGDGVPTVTTTTYGPGGGKTSVSEQGESGGVKWQTKWNGYGQETYHSNEWWDKGKLTAGLHFSYTYFDPKDKQPSAITEEVYNPDTQTWGLKPPKEAKPLVLPQQGLTKEDEANAAKAMSEEKPKATEPSPEERKQIGKLPAYNPRFFINPWVGGGVGANQAVNLSSFDSFTRRTHTTSYFTNFDSQGSPTAAVAAGVALGTWFDYECCSHRPVLRYFGFSLNYSHYALNYSSQGGQFSKILLPRLNDNNNDNNNDRNFTGDSIFNSNGAVNSLGFQFNARYGWLPDEQMSLGRLQFQVGVGPAINIVTQTPSEQFNLQRTRNGTDTVDIRTIYQNFNSQTVVLPGLQAEIGVKYFILPQLSVGSSMQYDYYNLKTSLTGSGDLTGNYSTPVNHFIFKMNVGYNF
jgi:hypothetical protein